MGDITVSKEYVSENEYELFLTKNGIALLTSDIQMGILKELRSSNLTLADLSRNMSISQSTLATNLTKMTDEYLITSFPDPTDNRKIYYRTDSKMIASSQDPDLESQNAAKDILSIITEDPNKFYKNILLYMFFSYEGDGLNLGPTFERIGMSLADSMRNKLKSNTVEELIIKIKTFFADMDIGELNVFTFIPLTLTLQSGPDFKKSPARTVGRFTQGFLMAALKQHTGKDYQVVSSESFGKNEDIFKFTLDNSLKNNGDKSMKPSR